MIVLNKEEAIKNVKWYLSNTLVVFDGSMFVLSPTHFSTMLIPDTTKVKLFNCGSVVMLKEVPTNIDFLIEMEDLGKIVTKAISKNKMYVSHKDTRYPAYVNIVWQANLKGYEMLLKENPLEFITQENLLCIGAAHRLNSLLKLC